MVFRWRIDRFWKYYLWLKPPETEEDDEEELIEIDGKSSRMEEISERIRAAKEKSKD